MKSSIGFVLLALPLLGSCSAQEQYRPPVPPRVEVHRAYPYHPQVHPTIGYPHVIHKPNSGFSRPDTAVHEHPSADNRNVVVHGHDAQYNSRNSRSRGIQVSPNVHEHVDSNLHQHPVAGHQVIEEQGQQELHEHQ